MSSVAHFQVDGNQVVIRQRAEDDERVGDSLAVLVSTDKVVVPGLSYEALVAAGGGTIEFADDGSATILATTEKESA